MADLRTIALIFAICLIADFVLRLFSSGNEPTVDPSPPPSDHVNTSFM